MTSRRGRRNFDSLRRHRPLLRLLRTRRGEPGSGRSLPPRAAGAGQVPPGNCSVSPPPLAPTPPAPAPPRHGEDAASPAPGRIPDAMVSLFLRLLSPPRPPSGVAPLRPPPARAGDRGQRQPARYRRCQSAAIAAGEEKGTAGLFWSDIDLPSLPQVLGILFFLGGERRGGTACRLSAFSQNCRLLRMRP